MNEAENSFSAGVFDLRNRKSRSEIKRGFFHLPPWVFKVRLSKTVTRLIYLLPVTYYIYETTELIIFGKGLGRQTMAKWGDRPTVGGIELVTFNLKDRLTSAGMLKTSRADMGGDLLLISQWSANHVTVSATPRRMNIMWSRVSPHLRAVCIHQNREKL